MSNHKILTIDNLSLQEFDSEAELIPLLTPEDEEEMNNEELLDILKKPDEWSVDDYVIARKILEENGIDIPDEVVVNWKMERNSELKNQKRKELGNGKSG